MPILPVIGFIFCAFVGVAFAYYLLFFVPYTREAAMFENPPTQDMAEVVATCPSPEVGSNVAGCAVTQAPEAPKLPFSDRIKGIIDYFYEPIDFSNIPKMQ